MRQEAMARRSTVRWSQSLERRCSRLHPLHLSLSPPTSCGRKYKRPIFFFSAQRASTKPRISHNSFRLSSRGGISQGVHPSVLLLHSSVHGVTVICTGLLFISPLWLWDHRRVAWLRFFESRKNWADSIIPNDRGFEWSFVQSLFSTI